MSKFFRFLNFFRLRVVRKVIYTVIIISVLIFGVFYYNRSKLLKTVNPPQINFSENYQKDVSVKVTNMELLSGVTATDVEDGDLTLDVIIENISNVSIKEDKEKKTKEVTRDITYAVCDSDNNVTKAQNTIRYTDYKEPVIEPIEKIPTIKERKYSSVLDCFKATDVIDGDISDSLKIESLDSSSENIKRGVFPVVLSVTNSCGDKVYYSTSVTLVE